VVVLDLEFVSGRVLDVFPHAQCVGEDGGGQYLMDSGVLSAALQGYVLACVPRNSGVLEYLPG